MSYRPVNLILEDHSLTISQKFLMILDQAPTCICGSDCRTFRYLCSELTVARAKEQDLLIPNTSILREQLEVKKQKHTVYSTLEEFDLSK
jgi:hypothetical protein